VTSGFAPGVPPASCLPHDVLGYDTVGGAYRFPLEED